MTAQLLLTLGLLVFATYVLTSGFLSRAAGLVLSLVPLVGLIFVWNPDLTTRIAASIGIGRGADLMLYFWVVSSLIVGLILHIRIRVLHGEITALARAVALKDAERDKPASPNTPE